MTDELYVWLEERFKKDNHTKYHYLFDTWITNITQAQILGFFFTRTKEKYL